MKTWTANRAKVNFGEFLDRVQREPVMVLRHNRIAGVMVSEEDYKAMQEYYAHRLSTTLQESAVAADSRGLDAEKLEELLADES